MSAPDRSGNVVDLARARTRLRLRVCGYCGAAMAEGEREEDCSSAGFGAFPARARSAVGNRQLAERGALLPDFRMPAAD